MIMLHLFIIKLLRTSFNYNFGNNSRNHQHVAKSVYKAKKDGVAVCTNYIIFATYQQRNLHQACQDPGEFVRVHEHHQPTPERCTYDTPQLAS